MAAQAGLLGNFSFRDAQHAWALDIGGSLSRYDLLSGKAASDDAPETITALRELVDGINTALARHSISYTIPAIAPDAPRIIHEAVREILDQMNYKCSPTEIACLIIGMANWLLGLARGITDVQNKSELERLARNRIDVLEIECPSLQINGSALFPAIMATECTPISIRLLLRSLDFSPTNPHRTQITILCVSADPYVAPRLRLGEEFRVLCEAIQTSRHREAFNVESLTSCRPRDLGPGVRRFRPKIIHFSGHGMETGLCFEDENGSVQTVDIEKLAELFKIFKKDRNIGLQGVIMNACHTETQAQLIADAVGSVIAMEGPVSDQGAIDFARAFYGTLGDGYSFDEAFEYALPEAGLERNSGNLKPRLIKCNSEAES